MNSTRLKPKELGEQYLFTARQQRDAALHKLDGIISGIRMDHVVNAIECDELKLWLTEHAVLAPRDSIVEELVSSITQAIADGVLTAEEREDIRYLLSAAKWGSKYYSPATYAAQEFEGVLHGIVADRKLNDKEIVGLRNRTDAWMEKYPGLATTWPFTEVSSALTHVLKDRRIDADERAHLLRIFSMFSGFEKSTQALSESNHSLFLGTICAVQPEITFGGRLFCFTGISKRWSRVDLADIVYRQGGSFIDSIRQDIDYLVVGDQTSPCWAFTRYGRKIEWAINQRKAGGQILIIRESDFADAVTP